MDRRPRPEAEVGEYKKPGFGTKIGNAGIKMLSRLGLRPSGAEVLAVRGRKTGEWRTTPVNPLDIGEVRYLVAPRGDTHWARNLRAGSEAELRVGGKAKRIKVAEVASTIDKAAIIDAYLERWGSVTRSHFGVGKEPTAEEMLRVAERTPVFRVIS